jgi:hypothetical protein
MLMVIFWKVWWWLWWSCDGDAKEGDPLLRERVVEKREKALKSL